MEFVYPASPSWYCSRVLDANDRGIICFGAKNSLYIWNIQDPKRPTFVSHILAHKERIVGLSLCRAASQETPDDGQSGKTDLLRGCSASEDGKVRLWNLSTEQMIGEHDRHKAKPTSVHWSPIDAELVASGDEKGEVIVYNVATAAFWNWRSELPHSHVFCLTFSPHSRYHLAVGFKTSGIVILDVSRKYNAAIISRLKGHDEEIQCLAWCPPDTDPSKLRSFADKVDDARDIASDVLASSSKDRTIRIWSVSKSCQIAPTLHLPRSKGHRDGEDTGFKARIWIALAWSKHFGGLVSSGANGEIISWNLADSSKDKWSIVKPGTACKGHNRIIFNLAYSDHNDRYLISTSMDRQIIVWDLENSCAVQTVSSLGGFVYAIAQSPIDSETMAIGVGDSHIRVVNTRNPYDVRTFWQGIRSKVTALAWHPKTEAVLAYGTEDGRVGILNVMSGKQPMISSSYHKRIVYVVTWGSETYSTSEVPSTADSISLYSVGDGVILQHKQENLLQPARDIAKIIGNANGDKASMRTEMAWNHDRTCVAIGNEDGSIDVMIPPHLTRVCSIQVHKKLVNCIRWHPYYTAETGAPSRYRYCLASGSNETVVHVYDLERILTVRDRSVALIEGNKTVITESLCKLEGHTNRIVGLCWSLNADGMLGSASYDWTVQVWDISRDGDRRVASFCGHHGRVLCVQWSSDNPDLIYSGADDHAMIAWYVSKQTDKKQLSVSHRIRPKSKPKSVRQNSAASAAVLTETIQASDTDKAIGGITSDISEVGFKSMTDSDSQELRALLNAKREKLVSHSLATTDSKDSAFDQSKFDDNEIGVLPRRTAAFVSESFHDLDSGLSKVESAKNRKKKRSSRSLFPKSSTADNRGKSPTRQDCIDLAKIKRDPAASATIPEHLFHLGCFVSRRGVAAQCKQEAAYHTEHENFEQLAILSAFTENIEDTLRQIADKKELSEFMLALAPRVSYEFWEELSAKYVEQLVDDGMYHKAAAFLLTSRTPHDAVRLLEDNGLYKDAVCLARMRLDPNDKLLRSVTFNWGYHLAKDGNYELAAKCFLAFDDVEEAAKCLAKRSDRGGLRAAALVAAAADYADTSIVYAQKFVYQCLIDSDWASAKELIKHHSQFDFLAVMTSTYFILISELSAKNLVADLSVDPFSKQPLTTIDSSNHEKAFEEIASDASKSVVTNSSSSPLYLLRPALVDGKPFLVYLVNCLTVDWHIDVNKERVNDLCARLLKLRESKQSQTNLKQILIEVSMSVALGTLRLLAEDLDGCAAWFNCAISLCVVSDLNEICLYLVRLLLFQGTDSLKLLSRVLSNSKPDNAFSNSSEKMTECCGMIGDSSHTVSEASRPINNIDCLHSLNGLIVIQQLLLHLERNKADKGRVLLQNPVFNCNLSVALLKELSSIVLKGVWIKRCRLNEEISVIQKATAELMAKHRASSTVAETSGDKPSESFLSGSVNVNSDVDVTKTASILTTSDSIETDIRSDGGSANTSPVKIERLGSASGLSLNESNDEGNLASESMVGSSAALEATSLLNSCMHIHNTVRLARENLSAFITSLITKSSTQALNVNDYLEMSVEKLICDEEAVNETFVVSTDCSIKDSIKTGQQMQSCIENDSSQLSSCSSLQVLESQSIDERLSTDFVDSNRNTQSENKESATPDNCFLDEKYSESNLTILNLALELARVTSELENLGESLGPFAHPLECAALLAVISKSAAALAERAQNVATLPNAAGDANSSLSQQPNYDTEDSGETVPFSGNQGDSNQGNGSQGDSKQGNDIQGVENQGSGDEFKLAKGDGDRHSNGDLRIDGLSEDYLKFRQDTKRWGSLHAYTRQWAELFQEL